MTNFYSKKATRVRRKKRTGSAFGLSFEALEDRRMLAAVTVNTAADIVDGNTFSIGSLIANPGADGAISLREAVEAGTGLFDEDPTINFDASVFNGEAEDVIRLQETLFIFEEITIDAGDLGVVISGDTLGDDALIPGSFITDVSSNVNDADNVRALRVSTFPQGTLTLRGLTITGGVNNDSNREGGGIDASSVNLVIDNGVISGNSSVTDGGGISHRFGGRLELTNSIISDNRASEAGGGIYARDAEVTLNNSVVNSNVALDGGGLYNTSGNYLATTTIIGSEIRDNFAERSGGGILSSGRLNLDRSTVSGNQALSNGGGIAVFSASSVIASSTTVTGNLAGELGGGIWSGGSSMEIADSTVSGNVATDAGGAIWGRNTELTLADSTVTENQSSIAGAVTIDTPFSFSSGSLTTMNSIVANNGSLGDIAILGFTTFDINSSLIGNNDGSPLIAAPVGSPDANGNLIGDSINLIDPLLGVLADNGGPTQTHALLAGSPAIDTGDSTSTFDQRGFPRPGIVDGLPDIGAYEIQPLMLIVDTSNDLLDGDFSAGNQSLREAIQRANANQGVDFIRFDPLVFDGGAEDVIRLLHGELEITDGVVIEAGEFQVVVSGDSLGNDVFDPTTFIVDIAASNAAGSLTDNSGVFSIATSSDQSVSLSGLTITGGNASEDGGGISASFTDIQLTGVNVSGNQSSGIRGGGGIMTEGQLTLDESTVSGNFSFITGVSGGGVGGGIAAFGSAVVTVTNSTVSENSATNNGGGIYTAGSDVTLVDSAVSNNSSGREGGGVSTQAGDINLTNSTVSDNQSVLDGGGIESRSGPVSLSASTVSGNVATGSSANGGGIASGSRLVSLTDSTVSGNQSGSDGGGIYTESASVSLLGSTISGNSTTGNNGNGGGIATRSGSVSITASSVNDNQSVSDGGGIYSLTSSITVSESTISGNTTNGTGGGISTQSGTVSLAGSTVSNNQSFSSGGGIFTTTGSVSISESTISGNSATGRAGGGGGISAQSGSVSLIESVLSDNQSFSEGGGIFASSGSVLISESTISGNSTVGSSNDGGGVFVGSGVLTLNSSTFSGNSSVGSGGGLFLDDGEALITSSTFSGNNAAAAGGGIYVNSGDISIFSSTVAFNESTLVDGGGGLFNANSFGISTFEIRNSIIATNTAAGVASDLNFDASDPLDLEFSLIGSNTTTPLLAAPAGSPDANGNLIGTGTAVIDPLLASLSNGGAPTQTHGLLDNSPAIDSGSSTLTNDQRGFPFVRNAGAGVDIGAFELQSLELLVDTADDVVDGNYTSGELSLREAVLLTNSNRGEDLIRFDADEFNGLTFSDTIFLSLGELTVSESLRIDGEDLGIVISGDANRDDFNSIGDITDLDQSSDLSLEDNSGVLNITAAAGETVTLSGLTITGGIGQFGGISNSAADLMISESNISGNRGSGDGGGISNDSGSLTIDRSTISGNRTSVREADGGGIYSDGGDVSISFSTINDNQTAGAGADGGGIYTNNGSITLTLSTVSGNRTLGDNADGGGIASFRGDLVLDNVTVTQNIAAGEGGGVYVADFTSSPAFTLNNTIVAGNDASNQPDLAFDSRGLVDIQFSLIGDNTGTSLVAAPVGSPDSNGNLIGTAGAVIDPLLGALADNRGPSFTHELLSGSPAIDAGNSIFDIDQRDDPFFPRDDGGGVDIGSFERLVFNLVVDNSSDIDDGDNSAGNLSLREALSLSNRNPTTDTIIFDPAVFDGETADIIRLVDSLSISDGVIIDAGTSGIVITGDTAGNDVLVAGSNLTDTFASETSDTLDDNARVLDITTAAGELVTITGLTITGGANSGNGGGISNIDGDLELTRSVVSGNRVGSFRRGGGIYSEDGQITLNETVVNDNFGEFYGGGIHSFEGAVILNNSSVNNNVSESLGDGGGIYTLDGDVMLNDSSVNNNTSSGDGGGIHTDGGNVTLHNSTASGNTADEGGGIHTSFGDVLIVDSSVDNNTATGSLGDGGGIHNSFRDVTLIRSSVSNNSAGRRADGGGIYTSNGDVSLTDSTVSNNSTRGNGGGIRNFNGVVEVIRSTISFNQSEEDGGGIETTLGELFVNNSTISGNQAGGDGGGVYTDFNQVIEFNSTTIVNNQSGGDGGGIHGSDRGSAITINNSIVAGNITTEGAGPDLELNSGLFPVVRFSLIGNNAGSGLSASSNVFTQNLIGTPDEVIDPLLSELADHGGPTLTHTLLSGSPALNAGGGVTSDFRVIDQRGAIRVVDGGLDIGAVEGVFFGPQVADVILSSSSFRANFVDAIDGAGTGDGNGLGYSLVRNQQLDSVPWQGIDTLHLQFLTDVSASLDDGDILLTGTNGGDYSLGPISFDTDSFVATVPILGGIGNDSLVISIFGGTVFDDTGLPVLGDDGGQFNFRFNVLPGDADGSGQVNVQDSYDVFASNTDLTIANNTRLDIDGSGQITAIDAQAAFASNTNGLPDSPIAPVPTAAIVATTSNTHSEVTVSQELTLEEPISNEVLAETPASDGDVLVQMPASRQAGPIQMPASERVVLADVPVTVYEHAVVAEISVSDADETTSSDASVAALAASIDAVFAETSVVVATSSNELVSESTSLPVLLFSPEAMTDEPTDQTKKTSSDEFIRLIKAPELVLAGSIKLEATDESERDYFSETSKPSDELTTAALDSFFQDNQFSDL